MPAATKSRPADIETPESTDAGPAWRTVLFNCECHTFEDVERQLVKAISCGLGRARALSWEVHSKGSAVVFSGPRQRCEAVAAVLEDIRLIVKVTD